MYQTQPKTKDPKQQQQNQNLKFKRKKQYLNKKDEASESIEEMIWGLKCVK